MKKLLLILLCVPLIFSCKEKKDNDTENTEENKNIERESQKDTVKRYEKSETNFDEKPEVLILKATGKPLNGLMYAEVENGGSFEQEYKDGKMNGKAVSWYPNGQIMYQTNYIDGKENGLQRQWHQNGQLRSETNYKDHVPDGSSKKWDKNGILRSDHFFKQGQPDGIMKEFDENGLLRLEGVFVMGKLIGENCYEEGIKTDCK